MARFSPTGWSTTALVTTALLLAAAGFFVFAHENDAPWEGLALKRAARALQVEKSEVPREVFHNFQKLGEMNLGVDGYQQIGLWYAAIFVGTVLTIAALTTRWWWPLTARQPRGTDPARKESGLFRPGRTGWIGLVAILLFATLLRAPHLDRSIYFDEQDNLRRNFHGYLEIRNDGQEIWKAAGWREAFWENRLGNNPVFLSVTAQISLRLWRAISGAGRKQFDVVALRLPVFLAGLGSIVAIWWLLQLWGLRLAAPAAAAFAAIHPMHIDYSLQARGYAFVLLFVPLAIGFAWLALKQNRWRDWFLLAFSVFFCLWSYAGSVYFALALNAGMLALLIWRAIGQKASGWLGPATRLLLVNAVTGLLYLFLISPHLPQVSYHFREVFELIPLQAFWIFYAWSHYSTGTDFPGGHDIYLLRTGDTTLSQVLFQGLWPGEPVLMFLQWIAIPALILAGIIWLALRGRREKSGTSPAAFLMLLGFAAPVLALVHQQFSSLYFYYWYLSYLLPILIAGVAIGLQSLVRFGKRNIPALVASSCFFALFLWQSWQWGESEGRKSQATAWPQNSNGEFAVEFRRGRSLWIATRDGQSICLKDVHDVGENRARAGRE